MALITATPTLTVKDIATWLHVHPGTVREWARQDGFPRPLDVPGRRLIWLETEVRAWAEGQH